MHSACRFLFSALLVAVSAAHVCGADSGISHVIVQCKEPDLVAGTPLRVIAARSVSAEGFPGVVDLYGPILPGWRVPIKKPPKFDASGKAVVDLPASSYVFEALAARKDGTLVALRSDMVSVPRTTFVELIAGKPQLLTLQHENEVVELAEVAVRSVAAIEEVRWHRSSSGEVPKIVLTPGENARINVIGNAGPVYVAAWEEVNANEPIQLRTQSHWNKCQFVPRAGTPTTRSVTSVLIFPDSRMEIPINDSTQFLTNRRFMLMGYRVELPDGKCLEFEPLPYAVNRFHRFEFGGAELTPRAWAAFLLDVRKEGRTQRLRWRYDLLDPGGHRLNVGTANCGAVGTATRRDGKPLPDGPVDEKEQKAIGDPTQGIRVKVEWTWNGPQSRELSPEGFVLLRSEHFCLEGVPAWTWQSQNYLSIFERIHSHERQVTGRPGPAFVRIRWRANGGIAAAGGGGGRSGGKQAGAAMPFPDYEKCEDPFVAPWAAIHELMHTFAYGHGDEMHRVVHPCTTLFTCDRWYIVDHPGIVPVMARVVQTDVEEEPKAEKPKGKTPKGKKKGEQKKKR